LGLHERRVLGVLVEKALTLTTPDAYPMSVNALVTGCNQKSNRDPVLNLSDADVEAVLERARQQGLVARVQGARVERWRHLLFDVWKVTRAELAVLTELLLRGPQTEGELRGRAARMEPIEDVEALRAVLKPLAERNLVVYLSPEGKRGTVVTHGFHMPQELEKLKAQHAGGGGAAEPAAPADNGRLAAFATRLEEMAAEVAALRDAVADLQKQMAGQAEQLGALKQALGA
jgi:uncharacterized protein YceH (UPF0502 family)